MFDRDVFVRKEDSIKIISKKELRSQDKLKNKSKKMHVSQN